MKPLFLPLLLLLIANPILASHSKPPSECLQMYRNYLNDDNLNSSKMMNFVDSCMPSKQRPTDEPLSRKLLQIEDDNKQIVTLKI